MAGAGVAGSEMYLFLLLPPEKTFVVILSEPRHIFIVFVNTVF